MMILAGCAAPMIRPTRLECAPEATACIMGGDACRLTDDEDKQASAWVVNDCLIKDYLSLRAAVGE